MTTLPLCAYLLSQLASNESARLRPFVTSVLEGIGHFPFEGGAHTAQQQTSGMTQYWQTLQACRCISSEQADQAQCPGC